MDNDSTKSLADGQPNKDVLSRRKAIVRIATTLAAVAGGANAVFARSDRMQVAYVDYAQYSEVYIDYSRYKEVYGDYSRYHSTYVPPP
jgi:pyruvate carboxylase